MKRLLLILGVIFIFTGCQQKIPESEKAFRNYMDIIIKNGKNENRKKIMGNYNESEFINEYFSKVTYKILEVEEKDDKGWITAEITTPDITDELFELYKNPDLKKAQKNGNKEEVLNIINKNLMPALKDKNLQYNQRKRRISMIKKDGVWNIRDNANGVNSYFEVLLKDFFMNSF